MDSRHEDQVRQTNVMLQIESNNIFMRGMRTFAMATCFALATALAGPELLGVGVVHAQDDKKLSKAEKEERLKYKDTVTQRRKSVGQTCGKRLQKVQEILEEEDFVSARNELVSAANRGCSEGFELTQVNRFLGYVYYALDDYPNAIKAYKALVNAPEADEQQRTDTRYTLAQLLFVSEDYAGAVEQLEAWLKTTSVVDRNGEVLLARGYYQLNRKNDALKLVEKVVRESTAEGLVPKESWLTFQWALYYEKERYADTLPVSRVLLTHYSDVKYWKQIAAMYGALEREEKERLALELTYMQDGLEKEKQLIALAYQYLTVDVPYRAAKVIEKGMADGIIERTEKNLELLGSAYQRAQEFKKASPVLEEAAKKSSDGNAYSRLASVYINLDQNEKALVAARNALKKGGLKREDLAWMTRGSAEQALHCYEAAEKSFAKAARFEKTKKGALSWQQYVQKEGERRRKLIANGAKLATCKKV